MRTALPRLRLVLAGMLAIVSLLQAPAAVFAMALPAAEPHIDHRHHQSGAQHHHAQHHHSVPQRADLGHDGPTCHPMGCCIGLAPPVVYAPAACERLLGQLAIPPARAMVPALPDPDDPPPRLRA